MKYWKEKCPICGFVTSCDDLHNKRSYGSPILTCDSCGKKYLHPDIIELAMIPENRWKQFLFKRYLTNLVSALWLSLLILFILVLVMYFALHIEDTTLFLCIGLLLYVVLFVILTLSTAPYYKKELSESKKRMEVPGYRETLEKAGYKVKWLNLHT